LPPSPGKKVQGRRLYTGDEKSNPFKREGYQVPIKNADEIFPPELFIVLDLCACQSATALSKEQDENPETNKVFGAEVLPTCKLVCEEGVSVLYGKNSFKFSISRHHKYIKHFRKWLCLNKVKGGSMMWSMETLTEVGRTFGPLEQPETILISSIKTFVRKIGKENAGRMTAIQFEVFLTTFDCLTRNLVQCNDDENFIINHDLIFKYTLTGLTEIRIAGYWDDSLGKRALSVNRYWKKSSNYCMYLRTPGVCSLMQLFCKVSKVIETFVKRVPQDTSTQLHDKSSKHAQLVLNIIELRKANKRPLINGPQNTPPGSLA
jgi:hypothetical protein